MADQMKNILIGIFVLAAIAIMIFVLMYIHPTVGDQGRMLHVRFANIDKVNVGTRVTLAGKPVGEVTEIREVEYGRAGKADSSGQVYIYELDLEVDSTVHAYNTDQISLMTSGLLGERSIEITPIAPKPGQPLRIVDDEIIYAQETFSLEDTLADLKGIGQKIGDTLDSMTATIRKIQREQLVENISQTARHLNSITRALDKPQELSQIIDNVHRFTARLNERSWDKVDTALVSFNAFASQGRSLFEGVSQGKGFLGKALNDEELYLRLNSILSKGETIFNDINHYGLFFHTDKGWQRLRARRLNLLQQLSTPQEFRNYFNDELDMINTSLERVWMIMSCFDPCYCDFLQDSEFTKVFAELLRRVSMMEEELKMYNTQVVDTQVQKTELLDCNCP